LITDILLMLGLQRRLFNFLHFYDLGIVELIDCITFDSLIGLTRVVIVQRLIVVGITKVGIVMLLVLLELIRLKV